jgi:RNA-directed DNA polymerase
MTRPTINLQDLRRRIYRTAKAQPQHRFWGLYVHVCKMETLREAYRRAKANNGAPGIDRATFKDIERAGVEPFLEQLRDELLSRRYLPLRNRIKEIPKGDGRTRRLGIPAIRDRVVQGALKLIIEPIFEADFQDGSYGYRPKRRTHEAVQRVAKAITRGMTYVIDLDLRSYFDGIAHAPLLAKVAERIDDDDVMHLLKLMLKAGGSRGVPQGGVISPLLSNLYLNEVDRMLERAKQRTSDPWTHVEYARFADDLVVLVDGHGSREKLRSAVHRRLFEELDRLGVEVNEEKTRVVDMHDPEGSFTFMGFEFRRVRSRRGKWMPLYAPRAKARAKLLEKLRETFQKHVSRPVNRLVAAINPILRGWTNHFRIGHSARVFSYVRDWVEKKVRRHLMRAKGWRGFGWTRWSREWLHRRLGLFSDYAIRYYRGPKARPADAVT